jgi:hypothetical protein
MTWVTGDLIAHVLNHVEGGPGQEKLPAELRLLPPAHFLRSLNPPIPQRKSG